MTIDTILALAVFAFVASMTPGPNNLMVLASGVNFGFLRTVPHMAGIVVGFSSLLVAVGLGIGALLLAYPALHAVLKIVGGSYLLYLAYKIATSRSIGDQGASGVPLTFLQAAAFQWVNPKAWVLAVTSFSIYATTNAVYLSLTVIVVVCALASIVSVSTWTGCGLALRGFLADPVRLKWFNLAMGVALALTLWPMLR